MGKVDWITHSALPCPLFLCVSNRQSTNQSIGFAMHQKSEYIIRLRRVIEKTGLSRSTILALEKRGDFPKKISLSPRTMGFLESEVDAWIAGRVTASRAGV